MDFENRTQGNGDETVSGVTTLSLKMLLVNFIGFKEYDDDDDDGAGGDDAATEDGDDACNGLTIGK